MKSYKIGVLISVYAADDPKLFERALRSIFNQDLSEEYTVNIYLGIDGPINQHLKNIVHRYYKKIYCVSDSECNIGLASTLNRLIRLRGDEDYFFRMDSDDFSYPNRFSAQIKKLESCPSIDILGTTIRECYPDGTFRIVKFANGHVDARSKIYYRVPVAHPTVCFRRRVFEIAGPYPNIVGNEDIAYWFKCIQSGLRFDNLEDPLLDFNISDSFWRRRSFIKATAEFRAYATGILNLDGMTWKLLFPILRFIFRFAPRSFVKLLYLSKFRC